MTTHGIYGLTPNKLSLLQQAYTEAEADKVVRNIKRQTRRKFSSEEKIRIVLAGLRGEESIA